MIKIFDSSHQEYKRVKTLDWNNAIDQLIYLNKKKDMTDYHIKLNNDESKNDYLMSLKSNLNTEFISVHIGVLLNLNKLWRSLKKL